MRSESVVLEDFEYPVIKVQILGHKEFDFGISQISIVVKDLLRGLHSHADLIVLFPLDLGGYFLGPW
jgi:hypothetical protein